MPRVELLKVWADDHIPCCTVSIDGKETELWWCGHEGIAAAMYANDSPSAMADLLGYIRAQQAADEEEGTDE